MLTAMDMEDDIVRGLDLGADDYMTKPFSFPELLARIDSLARRSGSTSSHEQRFAELMLDAIRLRACYSGRQISLTKSEFLLLRQLMQHVGDPLSRETLTERIWGNAPVRRGVLDTLVNSLRGKLHGLDCGSFIRTIRGLGYCMQNGSEMLHDQNAQ